MIPNENKQASYRCAECGWFTLPQGPTEQPIIDQECRQCANRTFVRDLTAAELIELYGLLRACRSSRKPVTK
jgi:DNA-directed RNA polymerase subunit RPC12/RpoP